MTKLFTLLLFVIYSIQLYSQNQNISDGTVFDGEPYLVIDPTNSQHLVAAWMGFQVSQNIAIKTSYSNDGGVNWSAPIWQSHQFVNNSSADVSMAYDLNGNLYLCYIDYDNVNFTNGGVYVRKSIDGGISFGPAVEAISITDCPNKLCIDRPWMVVDKTGSINDGVVYVTTMNADQPTLVSPPYNPYLSVSIDNGNSFLTPRYLDTLNFLAGSTISQPMPSPTITSSGTFYAIYTSYEPITQGPFAHLYLAKTDDAGLNITHIDAFSGSGNSVTDPYAKKGYLLKSDPSDINHLAYFFLSQVNGDADVYFMETYDGGSIWSSQQRINQDPIGNGKIQDLVWADFDSDGDLAICWRDRRNGAGTTYQETTEIYATIRWKDSISFSNDFSISDMAAAHDDILDGSGNDFMNVNFLNDTLYAVWGDVRTGILSIYLNKIGLANGTSSLILINKEIYEPIIIYPNPSNDRIFLRKSMNINSYTIVDDQGKIVLSGGHFPIDGIDIENLPIGIYEIIFNVEGRSNKSAFMKR